mmetsp:Transcript_35142/g.78086  ORF Transcript_35142/g.78086 Transcript_35142/m.78086 type:complete len:770 (+) Transcript_35142:389-2698(+)
MDPQAEELIGAATKGDAEAVKNLLKGSAGSVAGFINGQNENGRTALHWASEKGNTEVVRRLLNGGADKEVTNKHGFTALHYASEEGFPEIVQLLLDRGADTNVKEKRGKTPLQYAKDDATREVFRKHAEAAAAQAAAVKAAAAKKAAAADERLLVEVDRGPLHHVLRDPTLGPVNVDFQYLSERTLGFAEGERVGRGAFGDVFRGVEPRSGDFFAVKRISALLLSPAALPHAVAAAQRSYDREITALSRFSHPHIVRLIAFSAPPTGERVLVYEFLPRGSLADNLTDDALAAQLTWKARVRVLQQVATALNFLHRGGAGIKCFHRDVKSANICLTATLSAKLIDCGLAMFIAADDERAGRTRVTGTGGTLGTPGYISPEYGRTGQYSEKAEVFSFGVVVLEVLTGRLQMADGIDLYAHYRGANSLRVDELDERCGRAQELALELAEGLCALARACLMHFEDERLGLPEVLWQLNEMMAQHCTPTVEEGQLGAAREEMERLRLAFRMHQLAVAPAVAEELGIDCVVCMDPFPLRGGLRCGGGGGAESHFTCAGCLNQRTRIAAEGGLEPRGGVRCCGFRCGVLYEEQALAVHCSPESYALYQQARVQGVQAATEREVVGRFEADRLRREALSEADRRAEDVRNHIIEEILTLKCPRCGLAFLDFDACFALSCASDKDPSYGCKSHYCAFCLTLCGEDAHRHVAQCPHNINPGRDVFGNVENFDKAQRTRRLRLLREYLGPMGVQQRDRALQDCQQDLHDLGLTRNDLFPR